MGQKSGPEQGNWVGIDGRGSQRLGDPAQRYWTRRATLVCEQTLGQPSQLPRRVALGGSRCTHAVRAAAAQRLTLRLAEAPRGVDERGQLVGVPACELVHAPDRDARLAERTYALGRLRLTSLAQPRGELVPRGSELLEREPVETVELGIELGNDCETRHAGRSTRPADCVYTLLGYERSERDRGRSLERRADGLGSGLGPRPRLPAVGDRPGVDPAVANGTGARRSRRPRTPSLDRSRRGVVLVQLRGNRDREVPVPERRELCLGDGVPVRVDEPRVRDRDRDVDLPGL